MHYYRVKSNDPWSGGRIPEIPLLFLLAGTQLEPTECAPSPVVPMTKSPVERPTLVTRIRRAWISVAFK